MHLLCDFGPCNIFISILECLYQNIKAKLDRLTGFVPWNNLSEHITPSLMGIIAKWMPDSTDKDTEIR